MTLQLAARDRAPRRPRHRRSRSPTRRATLLGDLGYDPVYGARPLKRVVQKQLVDRLAIGLLDGTIREGETVAIDADGGEIVMRGATATPVVSAA